MKPGYRPWLWFLHSRSSSVAPALRRASLLDGPLRLSFDLDSMTFEADALQREGEDGFLQLTGNVLLEDEQVRLHADTLLLDTDRRQAERSATSRSKPRAATARPG